MSVRRRTKSSLAIVEKAYRGALEEQYGNIVWLSECMRAMGANHNLLLCGAAVAICFSDVKPASTCIGSLTIVGVNNFPGSIRSLVETGCRVSVLAKDLEVFGSNVQLIDGVEICESIADICLEHDSVWFW